jgi:alpha-N-acetylglucosamine transferase
MHTTSCMCTSFRNGCKLSRYTKLRLWDEEDDFDLILFMDADTLAVGRVEAVLDWFAPNGIAKTPMGAVYDILGDRTTFNAGVLAVRTNRTLFKEMEKAAENREVHWEAFFAEQV